MIMVPPAEASDEAMRLKRELLENVHPASWRNPEPCGAYDLVILGAGPAGLLAAHGAAILGVKVALIERDLLGGNRLNFGCVPSKALIRTSRLYARMRDAPELGVPHPSGVQTDVRADMQRIQRIQTRLSRNDSAERLRATGVDVFFGAASFIGPALEGPHCNRSPSARPDDCGSCRSGLLDERECLQPRCLARASPGHRRGSFGL